MIILGWIPIFGAAQQAKTGNDSLQAARHEFSVRQAVDYATKNNVQVKNALLNVQVQEQTNRELTAAALPQISGSGSMTYNAKLPVSIIPA